MSYQDALDLYHANEHVIFHQRYFGNRLAAAVIAMLYQAEKDVHQRRQFVAAVGEWAAANKVSTHTDVGLTQA